MRPRTTPATLKLSVEACPPNISDCRTKESHFLFLGKTCRWQRLETTSPTIASKNLKISTSRKMSAQEKKVYEAKEYRDFLRALMAEWLSNWTWNPKGLSRRFEPCSQHSISFFRNIMKKSWNYELFVVLANNWDWRTKSSHFHLLRDTYRLQRLE